MIEIKSVYFIMTKYGKKRAAKPIIKRVRCL